MSCLLRYRAVLAALLPLLLLIFILIPIKTDFGCQDGPTDGWREDFNSSLVRDSLRRLGHGLQDFPGRGRLWTGAVRLCVMFNLNNVGPSERVINLLISYYFPFFKHISLVFDGHPNYNFSSVPSFVDILFCDSHLGFYQHKCIRQCIQQTNSDTEGYLYISDDMFINITKMTALPKTEIWFLENQRRSMSWIQNLHGDNRSRHLGPHKQPPACKETVCPGGADWVWWAPPYNNSIKLKHTIESFPTEWQNRLKKHHGFPDNFSVVAFSDIIYIPARILPELCPVLDHIIVHQPELFSEVATSLAVNVASAGFVRLESGYIWNDRTSAEIERMARTAHFVHAIKLGQAGQAEMWVRFMEQQLHQAVLGKHNLNLIKTGGM